MISKDFRQEGTQRPSPVSKTQGNSVSYICTGKGGLDPYPIEANIWLTSESTGPLKLVPPAAGAVEVSGGLGEILLEQLKYLIQYPDEERDRINRVAAVLLETLN